MDNAITRALVAEKIDCIGALPLSDCTVCKGYLLERERIEKGTVVIFAIPYYAENRGRKNLSRYACARDYHLYFEQLTKPMLERLRRTFPGEYFAAFCDHSPIDEREAAAKAGLGILGDNGLLITEKYSSFVFLGEIFTTLSLETKVYPISRCEGCGACRTACPKARGEIGDCLSAVTQKKGELTETEIRAMRSHGTVWGCDVCSDVCPHTKTAIENGTILSPIPFFHKDLIFHLDPAALDKMDQSEFKERAYSWRGRDTIKRNLSFFETEERKG